MEQLLEDVRAAQSRLAMSRTSARESAIEAIRSLEARLVETLDGEVLRGMPNLLPDAPKQFYAMQLRGRVDRYLPLEGRAEIVLTREGKLAWAVRDGGSPLRPYVTAVIGPVADDDLRAEDLRAFVEVVQTALQRHLARLADTERTYVRADELARRLHSALAVSFT